jgi:pimeloyl-ACP methyl ester carboxylesterase
MEISERTHFELPVGYHAFHPKQLFNFQLNRWHSLGYLPYDAMVAAGGKVSDFATWTSEMRALAESALDRGELTQAAFYYRAEEFYTIPPQEREALYEQFAELFYQAIATDGIETHQVPYEDSCLHAMRLPKMAGHEAGTVLLTGFDSFIEGSRRCRFSDNGYDVIGFDGPGQGATRRRRGVAFDYRWERPAGAVLDYFQLDDVTLIGLSMGGWLGLRASAFEKRIRRVIATGHAYDYYKIPPAIMQWMMTFFNTKFKDASNRITLKNIAKGGMEGWQTSNIMYITKIDAPMSAFDYAWQMNEKNLHSELVDQDVLLLTGRHDHFIPYKLHDRQVELLSNARSLTDKVFTAAESAQNHCQIGNVGLALDAMTAWIQSTAQTGR